MRIKAPPQKVTCPVCELGTVTCHHDPGDPSVGLREGIDDFDAECGCWESGLVDESRYFDKLEEMCQGNWGL